MAVVPSAAQARGIVGAAVAAGALSLVGVLVTHDGAHASPAQSAAARYAVFQRAAKQADAVPVGLAGQDGSGQTRAIGGRPGFSTWAYVDDRNVCVAGFDPGARPNGQLTPSTACAPRASVDANGGVEVGTTTYAHDGTTTVAIDALVPDGASAELTLTDGSTQPLPVVGNAVQYATADADAVPSRLAISVDGVTHTFPLGDQ